MDFADLSIVFVCTGNICRSPMADVMFQDAIDDASLADRVHVSSCGIGGWHVGQGADQRAVAELAAAGHDGTHHRAAQLSDEHKKATLLVALDSGHKRELIRAGVPKERVRLLRSFDPNADTVDVEDPYYGSAADFTVVRKQIAAAIPGLMEWTRQMLDESSDR